jgi:hypothetical protein
MGAKSGSGGDQNQVDKPAEGLKTRSGKMKLASFDNRKIELKSKRKLRSWGWQLGQRQNDKLKSEHATSRRTRLLHRQNGKN